MMHHRARPATLEHLNLEALGVKVVSLRCTGAKPGSCTPQTVLQDGDTLVLSGTSVALASAEDALTRG
jgi:K+/H+ antiporter YhaU regulatory subunit KhtT